MAHLVYQQKDFELNAEQLNVIQSGFYKCNDDKKIQIEGSFDISLVQLFLEIISSKENKNKILATPKHDIYLLFFLAKSLGISEYQTKFGHFLFGPEYQSNINLPVINSVQENMQKLSQNDSFDSYKIYSTKYQAEIEFSSVLNEKCLVDILDNDNPWFYQSNPNDQSPCITIYFKDGSHSIDKYTIIMSKVPIPLLNSKKWTVEGLTKGKKKASKPVWKTIDSVFIPKAPKENESVTRKSLISGNFTAIKITAKDKKLSLHSINIECDPPLKSA